MLLNGLLSNSKLEHREHEVEFSLEKDIKTKIIKFLLFSSLLNFQFLNLRATNKLETSYIYDGYIQSTGNNTTLYVHIMWVYLRFLTILINIIWKHVDLLSIKIT